MEAYLRALDNWLNWMMAFNVLNLLLTAAVISRAAGLRKQIKQLRAFIEERLK